jgi:ATP-dependent RNA helicase DDX35
LLPVGIFSGLSQARQQEIFEPTPRGKRKVVVATNIAEASITIDNIVYVVDCGFVKVRSYDPRLCKECLQVEPVSKAAATQRAGRAGRVRPGKVFRLYSSHEFDHLEPTTLPELVRSNLMSTILQLKYIGVNQILAFPFLSIPPKIQLSRSLELLHLMGAVDDDAELTDFGTQMAELPFSPNLASAVSSLGFNVMS